MAVSRGAAFLFTESMRGSGWLVVAGIAAFACASFYFALAESALFALGKWRARQLAERAGRAGERVVELLEHPPELLATLVFGNTLANAAVVALALWPALEGHWPLWQTVAATLLLILVGCELLPKTLAVRDPEKWSLRVAGSAEGLFAATGGLRQWGYRWHDWLVRVLLPKPQRALSDEEYQELLEMAFQQGTLAASEKEIILQIISLDRKTVKDVMKPRAQMAAISDDLSVPEMVAAARQFKQARLPLYDETPDTIVGVLNAQVLLLNPEPDLEEAMEFPSFVPETMNLLQLLVSLERQQRGLAMVLDEFGGTAGMVTIEDILEEVVGEIRSENEAPEETLRYLGPGRWRASGQYRLEEFRRAYPALGEVPEVSTLGGLILTQLEVVPKTGQSVLCQGLRLTAEEVDERRVRQVLVELVRKK